MLPKLAQALGCSEAELINRIFLQIRSNLL
jgi:hypothetical protein